MKERLPLTLATLAILAGWAALAYTVFGPLYATASSSVDSNGVVSSSAGSSSLFAQGLAPITVFAISTMALGYLAVFVGAYLAHRGHRGGQTMMLIAIVPLIIFNMISFGLVLTFPATFLAVFAALLIRLSPRPAQANSVVAPVSSEKRR